MKKSLMAVLCVVYLAISAPLWVKDHASSVGAYRYRSIYVIDDSTGWMVGENHMVRKRTDGVHSHDWEDKSSTLPQGYLNYHFNDVFFINADTGWIVGEYKHDTIIHDSLRYRGVIYKTVDAGSTWTNQTPSWSYDPFPTPFLKIQFVTGSDGYVVLFQRMWEKLVRI